MGKIGDLFVRLGVKNDGLKKGLDEAQNEVEGFGGKMKAFGAKAAAIWAAVGAAAAKVALDFVQASQKLGDAWDVTMSRCKAGWAQFTNSLLQWNWDGFGQRMRQAMDAAANLTAVKDMTFEVQNSIDIRKAKMREYLEELQRQARDQRLSEKERADAARKYLETIKPFYDEELALREKLRDAYSDKFLGDAGVGGGVRNRELLETFLTEVAPNGTLLSALEQYAKKAQGRNYKLTQEDSDAIDAFLSRYGYGEQGVLLELANYYQNGIGGKDRDQKVADIVGGIKDYYAAEGAFLAETKRMQTMEGSMLSQLARTDASPIDTSGMQPARAAVRRDKNWLMRPDESLDLAGMSKGMDGLAGAAEHYADQAARAAENSAALEESLLRIQDAAYAVGDAIAAGITDALQELTDQLFGLSEAGPEQIFANLLQPLADMAKRMGEIMIAEGVAIKAQEAAQKAGFMAGGIPLIAAGAALTAIGAVASSALSSLAAGGVGSTATTTTGTALAGTTNAAELTVYVKGTIRGNDIVISGQKTVSEWGK